jgi:hypothetical protein
MATQTLHLLDQLARSLGLLELEPELELAVVLLVAVLLELLELLMAVLGLRLRQSARSWLRE